MGKLLWRPSEARVKASNMFAFMHAVNQRHGRDFQSYEEVKNRDALANPGALDFYKDLPELNT